MTDPVNAPTLDGEVPTEGTPPIPVSETPKTDGTPAEPSPAAEEPPVEPTPEEVAEAARAAVPDSAEAYAINLDDDAKASLGLVDDDPLVGHLRKIAAEQKWPQGRVDDFLNTAADMAKAGLFEAGIDPAAEAAALGENAAGRRREVEVWAESLKTRGEIDDGEYGELMSLSPTAKGISLIEKIRKLAGVGGEIPKPTPADDSQNDARDEAKALRADPRYKTDREFRRDADRKWAAAWPGAR